MKIAKYSESSQKLIQLCQICRKNLGMNNLKIPISLGELIDKITILKIKYEKINSLKSKRNVCFELEKLEQVLNKKLEYNLTLKKLEIKLSKINETLWEIENKLREKEKEKKFDKKFIFLARMVYLKNDERAKIKRKINTNFGSEITEEKFYSSYN